MPFIIHSILTGVLSDWFDVFTLQTESPVYIAVLNQAIPVSFRIQIVTQKLTLKTFKDGYKTVVKR